MKTFRCSSMPFALIAATLLSPLCLSWAPATNRKPQSQKQSLTQTQPQESAEICEPAVHPDMIYFKHIEGKGVGYKEGYSTFGAFITPFSTFSSVLPFLDLRGHVFNRTWKFAANAGAGFKYLSDSPWVFGAAAYYDYRQTSKSHYNQASFSFEFLFNRWELRGNGYLPFGHKTHTRKSSEVAAYLFDHFAGHNLYYNTVLDVHKRIEYVMKGVDGEVGFHLMKPKQDYTLYLGVGPYYYHSPDHIHKHAFGGQARLQARITPYLTLQVSDSWDNLFHNRVQGEISVNIPFGGKILKKNAQFDAGCKDVLSMQARMVQPMHRSEIIVADKRKEHYYQTLDPIAQSIHGGLLNFVFVNASTPGGGDGTFEHPFNNINTAFTDTDPGDVFYIYEGTYDLSSSLVTQDYQMVLGGSIVQYVPIQASSTTTGSVAIPPQSGSMPIITNPSTTLQGLFLVNGDQNVFSGLNLTSSNLNFGGAAIVNYLPTGFEVFTTVNNATVINNIFNMSGSGANGVSFQEVTGQTLIANNQFNGHGTASVGILFDEENSFQGSVTIHDNTLTGWLTSGILIEANESTSGHAIANANIYYNSASSNESGIHLFAADHGTINALVNNNTASFNGTNGLEIDSDANSTVNATVCGNNFNYNGSESIGLQPIASAEINVLICNNSLSYNGTAGLGILSPGIQTDAVLNAVIENNIIRNNTSVGIAFETDGTIFGNYTILNNQLLFNGTSRNSVNGIPVSFYIANPSGAIANLILDGNVNTSFYGLVNNNTSGPGTFNIQQGGVNVGDIIEFGTFTVYD